MSAWNTVLRAKNLNAAGAKASTESDRSVTIPTEGTRSHRQECASCCNWWRCFAYSQGYIRFDQTFGRCSSVQRLGGGDQKGEGVGKFCEAQTRSIVNDGALKCYYG
jgi:hypothetical protein